MMGLGDLALAQPDGSDPTTMVAGSAPGESGVAIYRLWFQGGIHFRATPRQHLVCFQISPMVRLDCRMAGRTLRHEAPAGSLAICPAGIDCGADAEKSFDALLVTIDPGQLALAAAEELALESQLMERFSGLDQTLLDLARRMTLESADDYPNGPMFWNEIASSFIDNLVCHHTSASGGRTRGMLSKKVFAQLKEYVVAHLDEPIDIATLAKIAGRSRYHFSRVFTRSIGITPHRYVVYLRMQRAIELVREAELSLAEIAARTGFADQSHLSRWVRRVHGVTLAQVAA